MPPLAGSRSDIHIGSEATWALWSLSTFFVCQIKILLQYEVLASDQTKLQLFKCFHMCQTARRRRSPIMAKCWQQMGNYDNTCIPNRDLWQYISNKHATMIKCGQAIDNRDDTWTTKIHLYQYMGNKQKIVIIQWNKCVVLIILKKQWAMLAKCRPYHDWTSISAQFSFTFLHLPSPSSSLLRISSRKQWSPLPSDHTYHLSNIKKV